MAKKQDKSMEDVEREKSLVSQWLLLTEERNAVLVPGKIFNLMAVISKTENVNTKSVKLEGV